jgi:hypothetical protein
MLKRGAAIGVALVAVAAVVAVVVTMAGGGGGGGSSEQSTRFAAAVMSGLPPVPEFTPANDRLVRPFNRAQISVMVRDKECRGRFGGRFPRSGSSNGIAGSPSRAVLAAFGVLRLPEVRQSRQFGRLMASLVYADSFRVAQRRFGQTFEVAVARLPPEELVPRCEKLASAAFRKLLANVPQPERGRALRFAEELRSDQRYVYSHRDAVCTFAAGGGCEPFLYAVTRGDLSNSGQGNEGSVWSYLVPDGVATVTAHYPAEGPKEGFLRHWPRLTISAPVINNVAVWTLSKEPGDIFPATIVWRSASGKTIKIVYEN